MLNFKLIFNHSIYFCQLHYSCDSQAVRDKLTKKGLVHLLHSMRYVFSRFGAVCDVASVYWEVLHLRNT